MNALFRLRLPDGSTRLGVGDPDGGPRRLLGPELTLDGLLARDGDPGGPSLSSAVSGETHDDVPRGTTVLAPVESQEVWASGVTFERSRAARNEEAGAVDIYDRVYEAARPELFFKSTAARVRGPGERIGVRRDSRWDVPEPELGLVADRRGRLVGLTVGNDVSSRSIEGENPLYLPQAKVFTGSCALGPAIVPLDDGPDLESLVIELTIRRDGELIFTDSVPLSAMRRRPEELLDWLFAALEFPVGVVLLTGTSIVPPQEFSLVAGDEVAISVPGLGALHNPVEEVGRESHDRADVHA